MKSRKRKAKSLPPPPQNDQGLKGNNELYIQQIADIIRDKIAQMFCMLYQKHKNISYLNRAIDVTKTIEDDEIRLHRLTKMGQKKSLEGSAQHEKIKSLFEKIIEEGLLNWNNGCPHSTKKRSRPLESEKIDLVHSNQTIFITPNIS